MESSILKNKTKGMVFLFFILNSVWVLSRLDCFLSFLLSFFFFFFFKGRLC